MCRRLGSVARCPLSNGSCCAELPALVCVIAEMADCFVVPTSRLQLAVDCVWGVTVRGWSTHSCRFGFILPYYRVPVYLMMSCGFGPRLAGVGSTFGVWDRSKGGGSLCVNCVAPTHNRGPVPLVAVSEIVFPLGYEMPSMLSGCEAWHLIFRFCSLVADLFVRTTSH